jgi:hypothetical protein
MSYAEIRDQLHTLSKEERINLARDLNSLALLDDPEYLAEITRRMDDLEAGKGIITSEELYRILAERRSAAA